MLWLSYCAVYAPWCCWGIVRCGDLITAPVVTHWSCHLSLSMGLDTCVRICALWWGFPTLQVTTKRPQLRHRRYYVTRGAAPPLLYKKDQLWPRIIADTGSARGAVIYAHESACMFWELGVKQETLYVSLFFSNTFLNSICEHYSSVYGGSFISALLLCTYKACLFTQIHLVWWLYMVFFTSSLTTNTPLWWI